MVMVFLLISIKENIKCFFREYFSPFIIKKTFMKLPHYTLLMSLLFFNYQQSEYFQRF